MHILLIDDDPGISQSLSMYLTQSGFEITTCQRWDKALDIYAEAMPDLIILDINLPWVDWIHLVQEFRGITAVPILMLSARDDQKDIVKCLELWADDYVTKPFSPREIVARAKSILRRGGPRNEKGVFIYKDISLQESEQTATRNGVEVVMTKSEFAILKKLLEEGGGVVSRQDLMTEIMWYSAYLYDRTIDTHVKNVRKKVGDDVVLTVRGIGYKSY